ncbi:MAG: hypothetical protein V5A23_04155 [Halobacteriales archaeon]
MPDPSNLRDSTQIVLPASELDGVRGRLEAEYTVTISALDTDFEEDYVKIIGSPVVIKDVSDFLARQGISLP